MHLKHCLLLGTLILTSASWAAKKDESCTGPVAQDHLVTAVMRDGVSIVLDCPPEANNEKKPPKGHACVCRAPKKGAPGKCTVSLCNYLGENLKR